MRELIQTITQESAFRCSSDIVWGVITDPSTYKDWYGWPEHASLVSLSKDISMGSRLLFQNFTSSKVVTEYTKGTHLVLGDEMVEEQFDIEPHEVGCELSITIRLYSMRSPIADKLDANALEMLRGIKEISYQREADHAAAAAGAAKKRKSSFLASFGPEPELSGDGSGDSIPDLTPRRIFIACVMTLILLGTVFFSNTIPRGPYIPSSGLSIYMSPKITPQNIQAIEFDWTKDRLETELDCIGQATDSHRTYAYCCSELNNDSKPVGVLYVTYDAYDVVRRYAYINTTKAKRGLATGIKSLDGLSGRMTIADLTAYMGYDPTGYVINRSGAKTVFYGILNADARSIFSPSLHAELVIKLNSVSGTKSYDYYWRNGSDNPLWDMPRSARAQETTASEYLNDRYAYEKVMLAIGKTPIQCAVLFGPGVEDAEGERSYRRSNPQGTEDFPRYEYNVHFTGGRASTIVFTNRKLATNTHDVLNEVAIDQLYDAKDLRDVESILGILPSRVACDEDIFILFYGTVLEDGSYPLEIEISRSFLRVNSIRFNTYTEEPQE